MIETNYLERSKTLKFYLLLYRVLENIQLDCLRTFENTYMYRKISAIVSSTDPVLQMVTMQKNRMVPVVPNSFVGRHTYFSFELSELLLQLFRACLM